MSGGASPEDILEANQRLLVAGLGAQAAADDSNWEREQITALIDGLAEGVIVLDGDGEILLLNDAASHLFGIHGPGANSGGLRGLRMRGVHGAGLTFDESPLARAIRGERFTDEEIIVEFRSTPRHVVFSANCLRDGGGAVSRAIVTCRDVTELRELEDLREEYLALVSHDVRSPLSIVLGLARVLAGQAVREGDSERAETIRFIEESATRIDALVEDLLESFHLESGTVKLEREPLAFLPFITAIVNRLNAGHAGEPIQLVCTSPVDDILADGRRLERVLSNLISNALKYSPPDSPIVVTVQSAPRQVSVSVRDDGPGISASDTPYIFDRFYRVRRTSGAVTGTGLGLHISRLIVAAHGGDLWVDSELGRGSTFSFALPRADRLSQDS